MHLVNWHAVAIARAILSGVERIPDGAAGNPSDPSTVPGGGTFTSPQRNSLPRADGVEATELPGQCSGSVSCPKSNSMPDLAPAGTGVVV